MKFSEIKQLINRIEAAIISNNPDPEITFFIFRDDLVITEKDSNVFLTITPNNESYDNAKSMMVVTPENNHFNTKQGDFAIPCMNVPFYK